MTTPFTTGADVSGLQAESTQGTIRFADLKGRAVILYFYPRDNTPGCTLESQNFRDLHDEFQKAEATVIGISRDSMSSHHRFCEKQSLPFALISDPDETLCEKFGVMKLKNMYGKQVRGIERSTFLIDREGRIAREWRGVKVPGHAEAVLEAVREL